MLRPLVSCLFFFGLAFALLLFSRLDQPSWDGRSSPGHLQVAKFCISIQPTGHLQNGGISIPFGMAPRFRWISGYFPLGSGLCRITSDDFDDFAYRPGDASCFSLMIFDDLLPSTALLRTRIKASRTRGNSPDTSTHIHSGSILQNTLLSESGSRVDTTFVLVWPTEFYHGLESKEMKDILHVNTRIAVQSMLRKRAAFGQQGGSLALYIRLSLHGTNRRDSNFDQPGLTVPEFVVPPSR